MYPPRKSTSVSEKRRKEKEKTKMLSEKRTSILEVEYHSFRGDVIDLINTMVLML